MVYMDMCFHVFMIAAVLTNHSSWSSALLQHATPRHYAYTGIYLCNPAYTHLYTGIYHVYWCILMYIYWCILEYTGLYPCILVYTGVYRCILGIPCILVYTGIYPCTLVYTYVYWCIPMYTGIYSCILVYTYVCILVYTHVYWYIYWCTHEQLANHCWQMHRLTIILRGNHIY